MKKLADGLDNTGGVCECCKHGAPWHRLAGGSKAATGTGTLSLGMTRASMRSRGARSRASSDYYDEYDDEYDSDEESDDDENIANEMARPDGMIGDLTPPLIQSHARSEGDQRDRNSLFLNGDSFGFPPRLSSTSRHLDKLLNAIAKYRAMGLSEDEIEIKIREDFPPVGDYHMVVDI
ncbi:unnamed protein product [Peronospora belbahrii]|uniref:Uncharacterized protein n=1 Tax=Peronospora belbahrii TaxID=622444 RepID=A0ABN8CV52_9STRA|nr:unnamed protein product [Peronospora belbahrii]